jgi:hypothetical protein
MRRALIGLLTVLVALPGAAAIAAPIDDVARQHFFAGTAALEHGAVDEAIAELQTANRLVASAAVHVALADAYQQAGDPAQAARRLRGGLRLLPEGFASARQAIEQALIALDAGEPVSLREVRASIPFSVAPALPPLAALHPAPPPLVLTPHPPLYKQWWLWTIVGIVATGTALGVGLGVSTTPPPPMASTPLGTWSPF